jgi:predicted outer membrane lipoprotein
MNDAVAIVLSRTLLAFKAAPANSRSVAMAAAAFAEIFAGSVLIGCAFGAASALAYKHLHMRAHDDALYVEAAMIVTFAWGANYVRAIQPRARSERAQRASFADGVGDERAAAASRAVSRSSLISASNSARVCVCVICLCGICTLTLTLTHSHTHTHTHFCFPFDVPLCRRRRRSASLASSRSSSAAS